MPDSQDCSQRLPMEYATMDTAQLQQLLREDAEKPEGEASDMDQILAIMEELARRKRKEDPGKTPEEALEVFKQRYDTDHVLSPGKKSQFWKRSLAAVLGLALILMVGTATARARNGIIAKWTGNRFYFETAQTQDSGVSDWEKVTNYPSLEAGLEDMGWTQILIPVLPPENYETRCVRVYESATHKQILAVFEQGDSNLLVRISDRGVSSTQFEKNPGPCEVYPVNGVDCYIFRNWNRVQAVWLQNGCLYHIGGDLSVSQMKQLLDSMKKE